MSLNSICNPESKADNWSAIMSSEEDFEIKLDQMNHDQEIELIMFWFFQGNIIPSILLPFSIFFIGTLWSSQKLKVFNQIFFYRLYPVKPEM